MSFSRSHVRRQARALSRRAIVAGALTALGATPRCSGSDPGLPEEMTVVYADIVMRHGARTRLEKSFTEEFGVNDGVTLTKEGEKECYMIGQQLRSRYIYTDTSADDNITTKIDGVSQFYDADRVQVKSSGYDRTLESAAAVTLGLYPMENTADEVVNATLLVNDFIIVPVHSEDADNDATLVASNKCPQYDENWQEFYRTDEFIAKQDEAEDWADKVFEAFEAGKTTSTPDCYDEAETFAENTLRDHAPYNLFDCANVLLSAGETQAVDYIEVAETPDEYTAETSGWEYLQELVAWVEDEKYEQDLIGRMIGGLYISDMFQRLTEVRTHKNSNDAETGRYPGMHISLGHYSTLKGIAGALDIGGLDGIPPYASHFSFELLWNTSSDGFGVRIMYQNGTDDADLGWVNMSPVEDFDGTEDIDEVYAGQRDEVHGIMDWDLFEYLMYHQRAGEPVIYENGEEEWCEECRNTDMDKCLEVELRVADEEWQQEVAEAEAAQAEAEAADNGVENYHVGLLSFFGVVLGIGIGICVRPCINRYVNKKSKTDSSIVGGDSGLESWPGSSTNGSFRLGSKETASRHVLGGVTGTRGVSRSMALPADDIEGSTRTVNGYSNGDGGADYSVDHASTATTKIPEFAPTSALGEPVPFPHRRQPSSMLGGVDSSMMTGVDADEPPETDPDLLRRTSSQAVDSATGANTPETPAESFPSKGAAEDSVFGDGDAL